MSFVIKMECKEVLAPDGTPMTKEGQEAWVIEGDWGPETTDVTSETIIPEDVLLFEKHVEAEEFIKGWEGHPWYNIPNGNYQIFEVEPIYEKVIVGYKEK